MNLCLNDLQISELQNGKCYKYLGQDEDIGFDVLKKTMSNGRISKKSKENLELATIRS